MIFDLVKDYADVLNAMPQEHPRYRILKLLDEAIRRDVHFIDRHPTTFFQCMWNTCWWYDCPEAEKYYQPPPEGWPQQGPTWTREGRKLFGLLEDWRAIVLRTIPETRWIRSLRPPAVPLGTTRLRIYPSEMSSLAVSPNSGIIAAGSWNQEIRILDESSGRVLATLAGHSGPVCALAFSPDGQLLASGSDDGTAKVWNAATGDELVRFVGHERRILSDSSQFGHYRPPRPDDTVSDEVGKVWAVAFSPDQRMLATGSLDTTVRLWNVATGQENGCLRGHSEAILSVSFSPNGKLLASACRDTTIRIWDVDSRRELGCFRGHEDWVGCVRFHEHGELIASSSGDHTVRIWNLNGSIRAVCRGHESAVADVVWSPDGTCVASAGADGTVRIWISQTGAPISYFAGRNASRLSYDLTGRLTAFGSTRIAIRCWDVSASDALPIIPSNKETWILTSTHPQIASKLVTWSKEDGQVLGKLWDVASGSLLATIGGYQAEVHDARFSRDERLLAIAAADGSVCVLDVESGGELARLIQAGACKVGFNSDGTSLAVGTVFGTVHDWDWQNGHVEFCTPSLRGIRDLCFVQSGPREIIHVACENGIDWAWLIDDTDPPSRVARIGEIVCLYGARDAYWVCIIHEGRMWLADGHERRKPLVALAGPTDPIVKAAFFPDGQRLLAASTTGALVIWDRSGQRLIEIRGYGIPVVSLDISGTQIACAYDDGSVRLWDAETGEESGLICLAAGVTRVIFAPSRPLLAVATSDGSVRLWDSANLEPAGTFSGHSGPVAALAFSPDGILLAVACHDRIIRLWDVTAGKSVDLACEHLCSIRALKFSMDGRKLASAGDDAVRLWDTSTDRQITALFGGDGRIANLSFSPGGNHLLSLSTSTEGSRNGEQVSPGRWRHWRSTLRLWDRTRKRSVWSQDASFLGSAAFGESGTIIASSSGMIVGVKRAIIAVDPLTGTTLPGELPPDAWKVHVQGYSHTVKPIVHKAETSLANKDLPVAWMPDELDRFVAHPSGRAWAVGSAAFFVLEGVLED